jgi:ubiquitin carboxyl-terminal hydrolase 4/11/15
MVDELLRKAEHNYKIGNLEESLQLYTQVLNSKTSIKTYYDRAIVNKELKRYVESERDLTEALSLQPTSRPQTRRSTLIYLLSERAEVRTLLKNFRDAKQDYEELLKFLNPEDSKYTEINRELAKITREFEKAEQDYDIDREKFEFISTYKNCMGVKPGVTWHIVSAKWFEKWLSYVEMYEEEGLEELPFLRSRSNIKGTFPGIIDNSDIIDEQQSKQNLPDPERPGSDITLKTGIIENSHFFLIPNPAYELLKNHYGCYVDIQRQAIEINDSMYQVEVFLKRVHVTVTDYSSIQVRSMNMSRHETISDIKRRLMNICKPRGQTRLWKLSLTTVSIDYLQNLVCSDKPVCIEGGVLLVEDTLIEDAELAEEDLVLLETQKKGVFLLTDNPSISDRCPVCNIPNSLNVPCKVCMKVKYCSVKCKEAHKKEHKSSCKKKSRSSFFRCIPCRQSAATDDSDEDVVVSSNSQKVNPKSRFGITGLQNLGNTCFMNSALQCLSHTEELTRYFLQNNYLMDLNSKNPLGTGGKLAKAYADLLKDLWYGKTQSVAPWNFKKTLSMFAPQFVGYQQHDAHELLCYILDGLHEDLNKVKQKPYFEDTDAKGRPDQEVANESWQRHLARNQSVILNMCHGQYKSTVVCPKCNNSSVTFDPFNTLSLPIPISQEITINLYYVSADFEKLPYRVSADIKAKDTFGALRNSIAKIMNVSPNSFVFCSITNDRLREVFSDSKLVASNRNSTLFAFELTTGVDDYEIFEMIVTKEHHRAKYFAFPRLLFLRKELSFEEIHIEVFRMMQRCIRTKVKNDIRTTYEEFITRASYNILVSNPFGNSCELCKRRNCIGCPLPYDSNTLDTLMTRAKEKKLVFDFRWKHDAESLGANLSEINKCSEHSGGKVEKPPTKRTSIHINECLSMFSENEELEADNAWYCPTCKIHVQATKKMELYKLPKILIIHLKRFKSQGYYREKLSTHIQFPESGLDLSPYVIGPEKSPIYDLYAISNHFGNLGGGHYTAYCYNSSRGEWMEFNDSNFAPVRDVVNSSAYVLFYKARQ